MLHVRDCPGTTPNGQLCPYPWCRKVKHLLNHLLSCAKPNECHICRPRLMPKNLIKLAKLNFFQKQQARKRSQAKLSVNCIKCEDNGSAKESNKSESEKKIETKESNAKASSTKAPSGTKEENTNMPKVKKELTTESKLKQQCKNISLVLPNAKDEERKVGCATESERDSNVGKDRKMSKVISSPTPDVVSSSVDSRSAEGNITIETSKEVKVG